MEIKKYQGLVAAPFTPMDKKGNLNTDMVPEYYDFLAKNGVIGAFIIAGLSSVIPLIFN